MSSNGERSENMVKKMIKGAGASNLLILELTCDLKYVGHPHN